jgi:undecaprenyl-diphosphatase
VTSRLVLAAGFALVFAVVYLVVAPAGHPVALDVEVATWIAHHRSPHGIAWFDAISFCGSVAGMVPTSIFVAGYVVRRSGWRSVCWLAVTMLGATALYLAINVVIERPRPAMGLRLFEDAAWSFPSGHATQAMAFWTITAILVSADRARRVRIAVRTAAAILVVLIGCSRIYLCAHWTTDVAAGFALGASWVATVLALRRRFDPPGSGIADVAGAAGGDAP